MWKWSIRVSSPTQKSDDPYEESMDGKGEELILFLGSTWILKRQEKYANLNSILQWELNPGSI